MGWCSGTEIFDTVCDELLSSEEVDKKEVLKSLIQIMWYHDWDCEYDSEYFGDEVVRECFIELDSRWEERFREWEENNE